MLDCEHATGPSFVLSDTDKARLSGLLVVASEERELAGLAAVPTRAGFLFREVQPLVELWRISAGGVGRSNRLLAAI